MKNNSKEKENHKEKIKMKVDEKESIIFNLKQEQTLNHKEEKTTLSPIALMKYRIEEMNRKLSEKRNQRK